MDNALNTLTCESMAELIAVFVSIIFTDSNAAHGGSDGYYKMTNDF